MFAKMAGCEARLVANRAIRIVSCLLFRQEPDLCVKCLLNADVGGGKSLNESKRKII
jgi:hypothetical protein